MPYDVMLTCRAGTQRLTWDTSNSGCWEQVYHTITWTREQTLEEAIGACERLLAGDPAGREIKAAYYVEVQEREERV